MMHSPYFYFSAAFVASTPHTHTHITLNFMYQQLELDSLFTTFSSLITLGQPARAAVPMYLSMEKRGQ